MRAYLGCALAAVAALTGCSAPEKAAAPSAPAASEPKITQLYAPEASVAPGEKAKICYGVENAKTVTLSPPTQELSAALARCVEVEPKARTTYTLTVENSAGRKVSQDVTIDIGAPRVKIANVNISAVEVNPGETVTICYTVANARSVTITPPGFHGGAQSKGCAADKPRKTTTYTVAAIGADGARDQEQVTVKVK